MAKKRATVSKPKKVAAAPKKPRKLRPATYKSFRLQKRIKHPVRLPSVWQLTKQTFALLWEQKGLFAGITLVYGILNLVLAQGLGSTDITGLKQGLDQLFTGNFSTLASSLSVLVVLVGSAGNSSSQTAGAYQSLLAIIASLAIIWALRQAKAGSTLRIRDAYYRGMYPLIPFVLVFLVIGLQLIPLLVGASLYNLVVSTGIAAYGVEKFIWAVVYGLLALLSLYMLASSLFALYIVTLPDMTPLRALRSARELVRHRRWTVLRKVLFLPILLLVVAVVVMLPIIIWLTALAAWMFFILTMFALVLIHAYMYNVYRELLNE